MDYTYKLSPHHPARLAIPNEMLGLDKKDFKAKRPLTAAVPQHHIDEAVAESWGHSAFWIVVALGIFGALIGATV